MRIVSTRIRRIRRAVAVLGAASAFSLLGQATPAHALWFIEMGPYSSVDQCQNARVDLMSSGTVQPCFTRNGVWYFKFAQDF